MPEEILETTQPRPKDDGRNWPKVILIAVLGLGLLAGACYAGYYYGTQEISNLKTQNQPTPTPIPSEGVKEQDCYSECIFQGFSSGYCDTAPVIPDAQLCEQGGTNIGETLDCFKPKGLLGVDYGCCCIP